MSEAADAGQQVHIPYDQELINEVNVERYEMTKTGQIQFSHPFGTMMIICGLCIGCLCLRTGSSRIPSLRGNRANLWKPRYPGFGGPPRYSP